MDNAGFTSSLMVLVIMVGALALLPWLLKRWQQRQQGLQAASGVSTQVLSSVIVGPNQRVVVVEVGHSAQKTCLVLGVTPQNMQCLHVLGASTVPASVPAAQSFAGAMAQAQGLRSAEAIPNNQE